MTPEFELLEHTSDIGVLARGGTREDALIGASEGLSSILVNPAGFKPVEERQFSATGPDEAAQIVNWLNEVIFFFDTEGMVFVHFTIEKWSNDGIIGHARGERFNIDKHEFRTAVKAATFHQFESRPTTNGWEIRVFVDV